MIPPLYKFRSINGDDLEKCHTLESLRESYVYFSNPTTFNDPFEFRAFLDYSNTQKKRQDVESRVGRLYPELTFDRRRRAAAKMMVDDGFRRGLREAEYLPEEAVRTVLIYCASKTRDKILLWSHYARDHTGICIEIDANKDPILKNAQPVKYSKEYPVVNVFDWDAEATKESLLYRKSCEWEYEGEYRALFGVGEKGLRKHPVTPSVFVSITFGAKIDPKVRAKVIEATRPKLGHIRFEQARLGDKTYSLEFDEYSLGD